MAGGGVQVMAVGNPQMGLMKAIIQVYRRRPPGVPISSEQITRELIHQNHWGADTPKTPQRTVTTYLCKNPAMFSRVEADTYVMDRAHYA